MYLLDKPDASKYSMVRSNRLWADAAIVSFSFDLTHDVCIWGALCLYVLDCVWYGQAAPKAVSHIQPMARHVQAQSCINCSESPERWSRGEVTKRDCWPIRCERWLPWEHIDYLTIWMKPVPCTCQGSVGVFVALLSRGVCSQVSVVWCNAKGTWYTSTVMLRDKRQIHNLNWQKSKMIDWWIRNYYEQMGEWDEGVGERKDCSDWIFITPSGQWGLVVMISCWGGSLDSLSLCVQQVFVSSMLTCFCVSAYGP